MEQKNIRHDRVNVVYCNKVAKGTTTLASALDLF